MLMDVHTAEELEMLKQSPVAAGMDNTSMKGANIYNVE